MRTIFDPSIISEYDMFFKKSSVGLLRAKRVATQYCCYKKQIMGKCTETGSSGDNIVKGVTFFLLLLL